MRLLVCGGRHYGCVRRDDPPYRGPEAAWERIRLRKALDAFHARHGVTVLIHGAAQGADHLARMWASSAGIPTIAFRADWRRRGRRAGPERNARMLVEGQPDAVVAFPGGRGTADMTRRALEAGVPVWRIEGSELRRQYGHPPH